MINCPKCGSPNDDNAKFCYRCYLPLKKSQERNRIFSFSAKDAIRQPKVRYSPLIYLSIILSAVVIILLMGYLGYSYWTRTPKYSLYQIAKAIRHHDVELFNKHVDVNTLTNRLIDDLILSTPKQKEEEEETSVWEKLGSEIGKGLVNLMKPRLAEITKEQIEKYIETGDFKKPEDKISGENSISLSEIQKSIGKTFTGMKSTKEEGKIALVGIGLFNERVNKEVILELKMRKKEGGYWQLVEFANVPALVKELQKLEEEKLNQLNQPIREKIAQTLTSISIKKSSQSDSWGFDRKVYFEILIKNNSPTAVQGFKANLECRNLANKLIKKVGLSFDRAIAANDSQLGTWWIKSNRFIENDTTLFETPENQLKFVFNPVSVTLADGTELKLKTSLD